MSYVIDVTVEGNGHKQLSGHLESDVKLCYYVNKFRVIKKWESKILCNRILHFEFFEAI